MLIRLQGCAGWSAPFLFAYGKNRFCHDVAHMHSSVLSHWYTNPFLMLRKKTFREVKKDMNIKTFNSCMVRLRILSQGYLFGTMRLAEWCLTVKLIELCIAMATTRNSQFLLLHTFLWAFTLTSKLNLCGHVILSKNIYILQQRNNKLEHVPGGAPIPLAGAISWCIKIIYVCQWYKVKSMDHEI